MNIVGRGEIKEMDGRLRGQGRRSCSAMEELLVGLIYLFICFSFPVPRPEGICRLPPDSKGTTLGFPFL